MADDGIKITAHGLFITSPGEVAQLSKSAYKKISGRIEGEMGGVRDRIRKRLALPWKSRGRQYPSRRPGSRKMHTASLPGYPPNLDTGTLRRSVRVTGSLKRGDLRVEAAVLPPLVDYAVFLEQGTKRMAPRPFFYQTIDRLLKQKKFQKAILNVGYAIKNDLEGPGGLLKNKGWTVVK